jgi:hypothetical protein
MGMRATAEKVLARGKMEPFYEMVTWGGEMEHAMKEYDKDTCLLFT